MTAKAGGIFQAAKESWLKCLAGYPLSAADYAVAIALSTYFNSTSGWAWPSLQRLATDTNRYKSTVSRSLARLERYGLLEVVRARGPNRSNRYKPKMGMDIDVTSLRRVTSARGMMRARNAAAVASH